MRKSEGRVQTVCPICLHTGEDEDQFEQFMLPLTAAFEAVAQMLSTNTFNEQEAKVTNTHPCLWWKMLTTKAEYEVV